MNYTNDVHPLTGEGKSKEESIKFWDDYADYYGNMQQGDIPKRIVERLVELNILNKNSTVLELGSGPGTYSLPISLNVKKITCLDSSQRMLNRLKSSFDDEHITNIDTILSDWESFDPEEHYDVCIGSLCPGCGTPESIEKMELCSDICVIVSWVTNHGDDLNSQIWKKLGKNYGYGFRKSTELQDRLISQGKNPKIEYFQTNVKADIPLIEIIQKEQSVFDAYGMNTDVSKIVEEILSNHVDNGIWKYSATNEMKLIYWKSQSLKPI